MEGQSLVLEPVSRNLQRISPVRSFHVSLDISPGVPGRLFGFVEAENPRDAEGLLLAIETAAGRSAPREGVSFDDRAAQLLGDLNRAVSEAKKSGKVSADGGEISALAAISSGVQIALSGRNASALRVHRDGKTLEASELLPPTDAESGALFSSLVVGGLSSRDSLLLAGRRIFDYIARDHLSRILAHADPEAARETILSALTDLSPSVSLAAFVVKPASVRGRQTLPDFASAPSMDSLDDLLDQATHTERMLNPALHIPLLRTIREFFASRAGKRPRAPAQGASPVRSLASRGVRAAFDRGADLLRLLAAASRGAVLGEAAVWRSLLVIATNKDDARGRELAAIRKNALSSIGSIKSGLRTMPSPARIAFLGAIGLGLAFAGSVVVLAGTQIKNDKAAADAARISAIEDKRDAIEASAIYSDSSRAWTLLDEARVLVAALPVKTKKQQETLDRFTQLLEEDAGELRKETSVENPEVLAAMPLDFESGRSAAEAVWNDRLYTLDAENSTITRHNRSGKGYGPGAPWVKSGSDDLHDGRSIAIDGSVFVGTSSGKILKYHLGEKTDFTPGRLEPTLKSIVRLIAPPGGAFLYLLVPETKRVVVLVKETGALVAQYTSPKFESLSDMAVDESKKTLYLLNGSVIYSLPLNHL
ncbi:hypothetical protein A3D72_01295 [Candidatus Uhrbacteria bacterium RIFCSPHIGHO2_02_FULL_57_19]|uniref:PPM-type phosphatase domain-containing protein n=1 Tax=Candidatus Uhrbacteria bacterium RIFCSPHIGHO2_02_FULL_57_19 TaxID=1802391 RepID=A0A1F7U2L1_9BACT|nr:MAG: hypothetical protein A3D72_01295 [Candidatus Uhrbacteria bacterium RIFCSPHIGHO2_02_FULL_57_19]